MKASGAPETLTYLDRATVRRLLPDVLGRVDALDRTYRAMARGRVENPPKFGVHPREGAFLHAMPAYLADADVTALKWVSAYPGNPLRELPAISALILLNDSATGLPLAVMDGAEITAVRTAAASGVSIRHLAPERWRRVAILGYGEQGRAHVEVVRALNPDAAVIVYGGPRLTGPEAGVEVAPDARSAVADADVVVTAGPMRPDPRRVLDATWVRSPALVVPVDFSAYVPADLANAADLLVTDDVEQFEVYRGKGHFAGWRETDCSLGVALDREPAGDLRISCSLGVGAADAALAQEVWRAARAEGAGTALPL